MQTRSYACPRCETPHRLQLKVHLATIACNGSDNKFDWPVCVRRQSGIIIAEFGNLTSFKMKKDRLMSLELGMFVVVLVVIRSMPLQNVQRRRRSFMKMKIIQDIRVFISDVGNTIECYDCFYKEDNGNNNCLYVDETTNWSNCDDNPTPDLDACLVGI